MLLRYGFFSFFFFCPANKRHKNLCLFSFFSPSCLLISLFFLPSLWPHLAFCGLMTFTNVAAASKGGNIRFTSRNCKRLNNPTKPDKILHFLHHLGAQIIYLQETYLKSSDQFKLKRGWIDNVFSSSFSTKSRGIDIVFHLFLLFIVKLFLTLKVNLLLFAGPGP